MNAPTAHVRRALLHRLDTIGSAAHGHAPALPAVLIDTLARVRDELDADRPDCRRLSLLGRAITVWHLDQGFADVPLHAAIAELGDELAGLEP